jgi:pimeloyl-ACP methyl ester carboxylesterase
MAREIFLQTPEHDELVVILHGLNKSPKGMQNVIDAAKAARPNADILAPALPIGGWLGMFCHTPSEQIAASVVDRIQHAIDERGPAGYTHIVLAGHSFGGVLARKAAIIAHGELRRRSNRVLPSQNIRNRAAGLGRSNESYCSPP